LQKIAEGTKHTLNQACVARWQIDVAWCC